MTAILERILGRNLNLAPDGAANGAAATPPASNSEPAGDGGSPAGNEGAATPPKAEEGPSVEDFMNFDPFEPAPAGKEKTAAKPQSIPSDKEEPKADGDALPPSDQSKAIPKDDPVLKELQGINERLAQQSQPKEAPKAEGPKAPRFVFDIPPQISKLLLSEDPEERTQGFTSAFNGLANLIHSEMTQEFGGIIQNLIRQIPQIVDSRTSEQKTQETAATQFFGRFANLKKSPEMLEFIGNQSKALAQEMHKAGNRNLAWNEDFMEALGKRIHDALGIAFPEKGAAAPQQQPNQKTPKKPSFQTGGGNRGSSPEVLSEQVKEIMETFN